MADASAAGFTGAMTFTTPGGTVVAQWGGSNNVNLDNTKLGQAHMENGDLAITSSSDSAISTSDGGSWQLFANSVGLTYTDFGTWSLNPCANSVNCTPKYAGTLAGGQPGVGQTQTMPTTGTATYSGGAAGFIIQPHSINATNAAQFYGTSSLTANFGSGAVSGSISSIHAYSVDKGLTDLGTVNNIAFASTSIAGASYGGNASTSATAGTSTFNIAGATGSYSGGFYGANAAETAGVFYLSGGANQTQLIGSFGAKQAVPSDYRVKREIEQVETLANGLKLYSWRYLEGTRRFTGVIAQDLLATRFADAVEIDYGKIGFIPDDFALMQSEGERAVTTWRKTLH